MTHFNEILSNSNLMMHIKRQVRKSKIITRAKALRKAVSKLTSFFLKDY